MSKVHYFGVGLSLLIISFGLALFFSFFFNHTLVTRRAKKNYLPTNCTILSSEYLSKTEGYCPPNTQCYYVYAIYMNVLYYNTILKTDVNATAYNLYEGTYDSLSDCQKFQKSHPIGSTTDCFFNKHDPKKVVFTFIGHPSALLVEVVGLILATTGLIFLINRAHHIYKLKKYENY